MAKVNVTIIRLKTEAMLNAIKVLRNAHGTVDHFLTLGLKETKSICDGLRHGGPAYTAQIPVESIPSLIDAGFEIVAVESVIDTPTEVPAPKPVITPESTDHDIIVFLAKRAVDQGDTELLAALSAAIKLVA